MKTSTRFPVANRSIARTACLSFWPVLAALLFGLLTSPSQAQVPVFTNLWNLGSGTNLDGGLPPDLPSSGHNVRGMAISPATTNVLYASTTGGTNYGNSHVTVLDSTNSGAYVGQLNASGISGGSVSLAGVKVADDGAVYACNIAAPGATLNVYRWASESDFETAPSVIYTEASVTVRYGDYMDVRGSGMNTEIAIVGKLGGTSFIILKPSEATLTTWTNVTMTYPSSTIDQSGGVAFEGVNNALYVKRHGAQTVYRVAYNLTIPSNWITATFNLDQSATAGIDYAEVNGVKLLSGVCYALTAITNGIQHRAKVFQLTSASNYVVRLNQDLPFPNQANDNGLGMSDIQKGRLVFSEPNNGISFYSLNFFDDTVPAPGPVSGGAYVVASYSNSFSVNPGGTPPLYSQWYFASTTATNPIGSITTNIPNVLALANLDLTNSGGYFVVVTNTYGSATSGVATLTVLPYGFSGVMTQLWTLAPGSRNYLTTDNTQRGMAYDGVSRRLVLVSRAPTNGVHLLDAATGADLGDMDQSLSTGGPGTFPVNMVGVADDGAVYVCNLTTAADTTSFAIYSWPGASNTVETAATQGSAFFGTLTNPGRVGDTFAARGAGTGTELLAAYRTGTNVVLFNTGDGVNFSPNILAVTNLPADAQTNGFAGLGLAWGSGSTFWAKSYGFRLRQVQYDIPSLTGWVIATYDAADATMYPIGVDNANGLLAGIGAGEFPQNLEIFDLQSPGGPALIDRELFPANNANGNGSGAVAFDVPAGRVFALDSNNGIVAAKYAGRLSIQRLGGQRVLSWPVSAATLQSATNVTGTYVDVAGSPTSPYTNTSGAKLFFRLRR